MEALLDLYHEGNLRPSTEEIAARSGLSPRSLFRYFDDVDDLTRAAMQRQQDRLQHLFPIAVGKEEPTQVKAMALVEQRFRLYEAIGDAALVARLRAPFQPVLAEQVHQNRALFRGQVERLFAPELAAMDRGAGSPGIGGGRRADHLRSLAAPHRRPGDPSRSGPRRPERRALPACSGPGSDPQSTRAATGRDRGPVRTAAPDACRCPGALLTEPAGRRPPGRGVAHRGCHHHGRDPGSRAAVPAPPHRRRRCRLLRRAHRSGHPRGPGALTGPGRWTDLARQSGRPCQRLPVRGVRKPRPPARPRPVGGGQRHPPPSPPLQRLRRTARRPPGDQGLRRVAARAPGPPGGPGAL